jgi:predicted DNA-binding protein with PD1-like motif
MKGLMKIKTPLLPWKLAMAALLASAALSAHAQEYITPTNQPLPGKAPGAKVRLLSTNGQTKNYLMVLSPGDELMSGIAAFAVQYHAKYAHYMGFGDATSAKLGWFDAGRKMFKSVTVNEPSEVTSMSGDISLYNDKPLAHTHLSTAIQDGTVHGGHLFELIIGPTFEVMITVEPTPIYKKLSPEFGALVIDPTLEK